MLYEFDLYNEKLGCDCRYQCFSPGMNAEAFYEEDGNNYIFFCRTPVFENMKNQELKDVFYIRDYYQTNISDIYTRDYLEMFFNSIPIINKYDGEHENKKNSIALNQICTFLINDKDNITRYKLSDTFIIAYHQLNYNNKRIDLLIPLHSYIYSTYRPCAI